MVEIFKDEIRSSHRYIFLSIQEVTHVHTMPAVRTVPYRNQTSIRVGGSHLTIPHIDK